MTEKIHIGGICGAEIIQIKDMVQYIEGKGTLRCGQGPYQSAIVVSLDPFILVSECTSMRWSSTVKIEDFTVIGVADESLYKKCLRRLDG